MDRKQEIASNLAAVRERIAAACASAGRTASEITLIAVTKTYPASDAALLVELGVLDIGENRDQEAAPKAALVPHARWHFIGQLQRNKCKSVVTYAHTVHSVDSVALARELGRQALLKRQSPLEVLIQVSLEDTPGRGGAPIKDVPSIASELLKYEILKVKGLMAVAPLGEDPRAAFERLQRYSTMFRADYPNATVLSAGMSDDLDAAIAHGATHVRIGSALLGKRSVLR